MALDALLPSCKCTTKDKKEKEEKKKKHNQ
jgi:hypothetical protein